MRHLRLRYTFGPNDIILSSIVSIIERANVNVLKQLKRAELMNYFSDIRPNNRGSHNTFLSKATARTEHNNMYVCCMFACCGGFMPTLTPHGDDLFKYLIFTVFTLFYDKHVSPLLYQMKTFSILFYFCTL